MTTTFESLENAYNQTPYPRENLAFIRGYTEAVGTVAYTPRQGYIRADRADGRAAIFIASGWASGFIDEAEARRACGADAQVWECSERGGLWGVDHPVHGGRDGAHPKVVERDYGFCPTCFTSMPATEVCGICE